MQIRGGKANKPSHGNIKQTASRLVDIGGVPTTPKAQRSKTETESNLLDRRGGNREGQIE